MAKEEYKSDDDVNITCFCTIVAINADVGAYTPLSVNLDGNLAHIKFLVGKKNSKGVPLTALLSLIDSGVGVTIGLLNYFEGVVMLNPNASVKIFTSYGGEYYSIFMHVIVSTDT